MINRLVAAVTISLVVSGCAIATRASALKIQIPKSPYLTIMPQPMPCKGSVSGDEYECVLALKADWLAVLRWADDMRRELEGACVKIGQVHLPPDWETNEALHDEAARLVKDGCYAK